MTEGTEDVRGKIDELRAEIDDVDRDIVRLLNRRAQLALAIRELKPQIDRPLYDPRREEQIFEHLATVNEGPLFNDNLREIYEAILHVSKEL